MRCEEVKELIMDYIDNEVSEALRKEIATHLDACSSCKRIEQSLRRTAIEPLRRLKRVEAPDRIWYQVRDAIVNKKVRCLFPFSIVEWFKYLRIRIRKPVLVPVAITTILLVAILFSKKTLITQNGLNAYIEEQARFLSQLAENGEESYFGIDDVNLGTYIERYLL